LSSPRQLQWFLGFAAVSSFVFLCVFNCRYTVSGKKGTNSRPILDITLTKFNTFSWFLAQFILTFKVTEKNYKSAITTCTTLRSTSSKCCFYEKINARVHFAATVVSKFIRLKSGGLQRVEYTAKEGVQNITYHWSRRPQTSHQNRVGQAGSHRHCCSCASVASSSFTLCQGGRWSFRALLLILTACFCDSCGSWSLRWLVESNSCRLIFRSDFLAVVSYDVVRFNTWRSFNSQGKVVTLIRCGGHVLVSLVSH